MITDPLIALEGVTREYGAPPTIALDRVSFTIDPGEMVAIIGPSGSGKSTLLNMIGTLDRASSGEVTIAGNLVSAMSDVELSALRSHTIGFVFQQYHLDDSRSATDNVASGLLYTGTSPRERRVKAREALERVGLADRVDYYPKQLSGGQRQRVAIARAVLGDPPLILADEPTGALDTHSGAQVLEVLKDLNASGTTVIIITHDRELADGLPRQISVRDGHIVSDTRSKQDAHV